jgi:predicted transglutaminase-like cysteine proteinase
MFAAVISKVLRLKSGTVLIAALAASTINALPAGSEQLSHVLVSGAARPPLGWVEFCARQPGECAGTTIAPRDLALSRKAWIYLVRVNNWVNETIKPLRARDEITESKEKNPAAGRNAGKESGVYA